MQKSGFEARLLFPLKAFHLSTNFSNMQDKSSQSLDILPNTVRFSIPTKRSTRLSYQGRNSLQGYIAPNKENEFHKAKNNFCIEQPLNEEFWIKFKEYLKTTHREKSVICRLSYAKKYYHILLEDNAQDILSLSDQKRPRVMKSLASLSKFLGCYNRWKEIKERYQLKWSNDDSIQVFQNLTNQENNYSSMLK